MKKPTLCSSQVVFHGFFDVRSDRIMRADGECSDYTSVVFASDAVVVIAETEDKLLVLNREYRRPADEWVLGCPGGRLEKNEDPLVGAQRELFEETGYWSENLSIIGKNYLAPGLANQKIYFIYAQNATLKSQQHLDPFEFIEVELKSEEKLRREIRESSLVDSTLCAALWYKSLAL
jgi:ADP-ribose pyrophosphatase